MAYWATVKYKDGLGKDWYKVWELRGANAVDAAADMAALRAAYEAITGLVPVSESLAQRTDIAFTLPASSVKGSDQALLNLRLSDGGSAIQYIHAPVDGIFQTDLVNVDTADTALNDYLDEFKASGGNAYLSDTESVDGTNPIVNGVRISRKARYA